MNRLFRPLLASIVACALLLIAGCSTELPGPPAPDGKVSENPPAVSGKVPDSSPATSVATSDSPLVHTDTPVPSPAPSDKLSDSPLDPNEEPSDSPSLPGLEPVKVTTADFEETVLGNSGLVMVDCYADWCGPCRLLAPAVAELAAEYEGRVLIAKLDTDANEEIAEKYEVTALPTLLFFKNGKLVDRARGLQPKKALDRRLQVLLLRQ
ncbi:thioredoxin [Lignipirellula cremea]|uniref:Thioredoxin n=1 Tax=Lignipirellula cremea TaxID=2528010 RepID=A0A518DP83_9BACT|nr:thioredoxin [Lignipirellula cremea]QDU93657.1 Thioredoxin [Lignipirellula cremea]